MRQEDYQRVRLATQRSQSIMHELTRTIGAREAVLETCRSSEAVWKEIFPDVAERLDLSGADFTGALFTGDTATPLDYADFRGAKLDRTRWLNLRIRGGDFTGASLRGASTLLFSCFGCVFREADLSGAKLLAIGTDAMPTDFSGANLSGAELQVFGPENLTVTGANTAGMTVKLFGQGSLTGDRAKDRELLDQFLSQFSEEQKAGIKVGEGGCFVATAACGTPDAAEVRILRRFRDEVLRRRAAGRLFIACYLILSPPAARWIARSESRRDRALLWLVRPAARLAASVLRNPS